MTHDNFESKVFHAVNAILLIIVGLSMLLPFLHIAAKSLSAEVFVLSGEVYLLPKGFTINAYKYIFQTNQFIISLRNSVFVTVVGTVLSMLLTSLTAYPLAVEGMKMKKQIMSLYIFTMYFSGGIIPTYLVVKGLGLTNSLWSLILPCVISPFNMIIIRNFFSGLPTSLYEAARIDGASHSRILFHIFIPLSKAGFSTIAMFYAVGYWNNFFAAMMYITDRKLLPMQLYLRQMLTDSSKASETNVEELMQISPESVRAATIMAATLPIIVVYPFVQKYFVKGVTLGAVKG